MKFLVYFCALFMILVIALLVYGVSAIDWFDATKAGISLITIIAVMISTGGRIGFSRIENEEVKKTGFLALALLLSPIVLNFTGIAVSGGNVRDLPGIMRCFMVFSLPVFFLGISTSIAWAIGYVRIKTGQNLKAPD